VTKGWVWGRVWCGVVAFTGVLCMDCVRCWMFSGVVVWLFGCLDVLCFVCWFMVWCVYGGYLVFFTYFVIYLWC